MVAWKIIYSYFKAQIEMNYSRKNYFENNVELHLTESKSWHFVKLLKLGPFLLYDSNSCFIGCCMSLFIDRLCDNLFSDSIMSVFTGLYSQWIGGAHRLPQLLDWPECGSCSDHARPCERRYHSNSGNNGNTNEWNGAFHNYRPHQ